MRKKYRTVDEAEDAYGITIDSYLAGPEAQKENQVPHAGIPEKVMDMVKKLKECQLSILILTLWKICQCQFNSFSCFSIGYFKKINKTSLVKMLIVEVESMHQNFIRLYSCGLMCGHTQRIK